MQQFKFQSLSQIAIKTDFLEIGMVDVQVAQTIEQMSEVIHNGEHIKDGWTTVTAEFDLQGTRQIRAEIGDNEPAALVLVRFTFTSSIQGDEGVVTHVDLTEPGASDVFSRVRAHEQMWQALENNLQQLQQSLQVT